MKNEWWNENEMNCAYNGKGVSFNRQFVKIRRNPDTLILSIQNFGFQVWGEGYEKNEGFLWHEW